MDNTTGPGYIAVSGTLPRDRARRRLPTDYVDALSAAGGRPAVFSAFALGPGEEVPEGLLVRTELDPEDASPIGEAAGLILTGGGDVDPSFYGESPHPRTYNISRRRDRFEMTLLGAALERHLPVLAVCRGMQVLNVHLGGTLVQHLGDDDSLLDHDRDRPRGEAAHRIKIERHSSLAAIVGGVEAPVNSRHHQGIAELAPPLADVAWADDGVIEAVESRHHAWVLGVQWHPETMARIDTVQARLFERFVDATASRSARAARRYGSLRVSAEPISAATSEAAPE